MTDIPYLEISPQYHSAFSTDSGPFMDAELGPGVGGVGLGGLGGRSVGSDQNYIKYYIFIKLKN